jgi:asparagine synthase (glutamine-hydrolysing)
MCGICGFYGFEDKPLLKRMMHIIAYRGPDQYGTFRDKNIMLGHQRLKIIDLSVHGKQPMSNEDKTVWIVFNGEIYNYRTLRQSLNKKHKFSSQTDTEVIVHGYEEYGEKIITKLNGDFAFALWDQKRKKLLLARDRVGVKPLYYAFVNDHLLFASEIKALLQYDQLIPEVDYEAINNFFTFRFVPGPRTGFKGIFKLMPGHYLVLQNGEHKIKKYWDISFKEGKRSLQYYTEHLRKLILESVERQLMSDVPLGAFIGGGIDSASIIAVIKQTKPIETFTMGFAHESDKFNEYSHADIVAKHFNTNHHTILVEPDSVRLLPQIVWHLDEPMADPSVVTQYVLAREAKKHVTVVLSGEGGDEVFGGYEQYRLLPKAAAYGKIVPNAIKVPILTMLHTLIPGDTFFLKLRNFASQLQNKPASYIELLSLFDNAEKQLLYSEQLYRHMPNIDSDFALIKQFFSNSYSLLNKMLLTDMKTLLPDNLLMNVDKLGLAHALEGRVPLLDYKLIEFAATIPSKYKLFNGTEKFILKQAMKPLLPQNVVKRKKRRFHVPLDSWYSVYLKDFSEELLLSREFKKLGFFDVKYIKKLLTYQKTLSYNLFLKHNMLTRLYYTRQLWNVIVFAIWHKTFIEGGNLKKIPAKIKI